VILIDGRMVEAEAENTIGFINSEPRYSTLIFIHYKYGLDEKEAL
jgi:hypothetical protein